MPTYKNYEDWYDNGPGSEAFKRKMRTGRTQCLFPNLIPSVPPPEKVFKEETYSSKPFDKELGPEKDMIRVTISIPLRQWNKIKQKVIRALALVRIGG